MAVTSLAVTQCIQPGPCSAQVRTTYGYALPKHIFHIAVDVPVRATSVLYVCCIITVPTLWRSDGFLDVTVLWSTIAVE